MRLFSWWGAFCFAVAAAVVLSLLLSGCASSPHELNGWPVSDRWGHCDRARIANAFFFCRQTTAEPVASSNR
jgi:starvation-inducible outer membrane lipoprotein